MSAFVRVSMSKAYALVCAFCLSSCTLVELRSETEEFYAATVLVDQITAPSDWSGPVIVAAVASEGQQYRVAHQVWLHEPGGYELIVPDGQYTIVAYGDRDRDEAYDPNEPLAALSPELVVSGERLILLVNLTPSTESTIDRALLLSVRGMNRPSRQVGAIARLDDAAFSRTFDRVKPN